MRVKSAVVGAVFIAAAPGIVHAQGSIIQDPGRQAPGNLTLQYLGPSSAGVTLPGEPGTSITLPLRLPSGRSAVATAPGYGSSTPGTGSGRLRGGAWTSPLGGNR